MKRSFGARARAVARMVNAGKPTGFPRRVDDKHSARVAGQATGPFDLDVSSHTELLNEAFRTDRDFSPEPQADAADNIGAPRFRDKLRGFAKDNSRVLKSMLGVLVVVAVGWMPVSTLLVTASTEAVINARLITLRAPIEGQIQSLSGVGVGGELQPGAVLVNIENPRADRSRLDDLSRMTAEVESEIKGLTARKAYLEAAKGVLTAQTRAFQAGRIERIAARTSELKSEISAAEARRDEAAQALARAQALVDSGSISSVALDKLKRESIVAAQVHNALGHRLTGEQVELDALRDGIYVGDSYNDRPQSQQRADEIAARLSEVSAALSEREARLAVLRQDIGAERQRYEARAAAAVTAPVRGSVWEVMTAPGETVVSGQELMRVLDCAQAVVTATVGETAYNQLHVGAPATFRFKGESTDHEGRIVSLTGMATAPANFAIQPSALAKEPYRVTVALPGLNNGPCRVGRTGRVTFSN